MKAIILALICFAYSLHALGQKTPPEIAAEGKLLYRSEAASWHGTDIFLAKLKSKRQYSGGYLSYPTATGGRCIFFSRGDEPETLAVITFDSTFSTQAAQIDSVPRPLDAHEKDLFAIRRKALDVVSKDTLFRHFKNTNLNLIPLITKDGRKVYALTGPQVSGVVVFGNDYRIDFDKNNNIAGMTRLHQNIIPINYGKSETQTSAMHSHLPSTGDYITATDICTLMLYEKFPGWNQYYVISKDYISIWDCTKDELVVITKKAWERISKDQKKRHPQLFKE
ncbi:hypothetical protein [Hymenobacter ruricola]|uniref:Uncharacterized protein n=1 Tax=Hymenobacter ruricola TaxID=2791023 RepID=A0ABS0I4A1_9BACT|nr:hypothetical protein [Hymenobacter ruricola]MBF9221752.1 hypothetical protein [Hymenobacter ruricola]